MSQLRIFIFLAFNLLIFIGIAQENCSNGIDDDNDGLIDLNDDDCGCGGFTQQQQSQLIPNPSFEDNSCMPGGFGQLTCADTWIQASTATSDYFNTNGFTAGGAFGINDPQFPLPGGGNGYVGYIHGNGTDPQYAEYIGGCLTTPMLAGNNYNLVFNMAYGSGSPNVNFAFWGATTCAAPDLPFSGSVCPQGIGTWQILDDQVITLNTNGAWQEITVSYTPTQDIYSVLLGPDCSPAPNPGTSTFNYTYIDGFSIEAQSFIDITSDTISVLDTVLIPKDTIIVGTDTTFTFDTTYVDSSPCEEDVELIAEVDTNGTFQWYREGIAISGANDSVYLVPIGEDGNYQYTLTNGPLCEVSNIIPIIRSTPPHADFTASNPCFGSPTDFVDLSSGDNILSRTWFMDGATYNTQNPSHTFSSSGCFDVNLIVLTNDCSHDTTIQVCVNPIPIADFTGESKCINAGAVQFNDASSTSMGTIDKWEWDFGDNTIVNNQNPHHIYQTDNTYLVSLTVETNQGCVHNISKPIEIYPKPTPLFDLDKYNGCSPLCINFSDFSSVSSGNITNWEWQTSDNKIDSIQNPSFCFEQEGFYDVQLKVSTDKDCLDSLKLDDIIEVYQLPRADFTPSPEEVSIFIPEIEFLDESTDADRWFWDFGDGTIDSIPLPIHNYTDTGVFVVKQIVATDKGCLDSIEHTVRINPEVAIYIPNTFTPNLDEKNDSFFPKGEGFTDDGYTFLIFDRWGNEIFESHDLSNTWDGTIQKTGEHAKQDVYVYYIELTDIRNKRHSFRGNVNLIR